MTEFQVIKAIYDDGSEGTIPLQKSKAAAPADAERARWRS